MSINSESVSPEASLYALEPGVTYQAFTRRNQPIRKNLIIRKESQHNVSLNMAVHTIYRNLRNVAIQ